MLNKKTYAARAAHCHHPLAKQLFQLLDDKKTNLALSADVTTAKELLEMADLLGPEICLLKTHIDIISDFSPDLTNTLQELAHKHNFLIFEDRKFADIGNTVKHQYQGGVYRIADWANIINAHSLPGPGIIQGLAAVGQAKNRGLLLLAEMSSAGHLMDKDYALKTLQMAENNREFTIGFITQRALSSDPQWLNITPGIQLAQSGDSLGQQYTTPEQAILENGSDIIIVGRGILHSANPLTAAQQYRAKGWNAYIQRNLV